jgi:hypothetical protein
MKQITFASAAWDKKGKVTRRERFLGEMDQVVPWGKILALIEPHYPKAGNGIQPMPIVEAGERLHVNLRPPPMWWG